MLHQQMKEPVVDPLWRRWSAWQTLEGCWRGPTMPAQAGLYRIRLSLFLPSSTYCHRQVVYIGQSGNVRARMGMLAGIYQSEMPFKTPHVAAPMLWALRHRIRLEHIAHVFEVSMIELSKDVPKQIRLGYEC